jgi:RimJ/RimL family protein N-acetyltransferase
LRQPEYPGQPESLKSSDWNHPRLYLRPLESQDFPHLAANRSDPEISRYQGWGTPFTEEQRKSLLNNKKPLHPGGSSVGCSWVMELKEGVN